MQLQLISSAMGGILAALLTCICHMFVFVLQTALAATVELRLVSVQHNIKHIYIHIAIFCI